MTVLKAAGCHKEICATVTLPKHQVSSPELVHVLADFLPRLMVVVILKKTQ